MLSTYVALVLILLVGIVAARALSSRDRYLECIALSLFIAASAVGLPCVAFALIFDVMVSPELLAIVALAELAILFTYARRVSALRFKKPDLMVFACAILVCIAWGMLHHNGWEVDSYSPRVYEVTALRMTTETGFQRGFLENVKCDDSREPDCLHLCKEKGMADDCIERQQALLNNPLGAHPPGTAVYLIPFALLFGSHGFTMASIITGLLLFLFTYLLFERMYPNRVLGIISAFIMTLNPFIIRFIMNHSHLIGLLFITALLYVMHASTTQGRYVFIAYISAFAVLIRPEYLLMLAVFFPYLYLIEKRNTVRPYAVLVLIFIFGLVPLALWNTAISGKPFMHHSQMIDPGSFNEIEGEPYNDYSFLGLDFHFSGSLNFPFQKKLYRSPGWPYPQPIMAPLIFLNSFGLIFIGIAGVGVFKGCTRHMLLRVLICAGVLWFLFLSVMESIDDGLTYMFYLPLTLILALGAPLALQLRKRDIAIFFITIMACVVFIKSAPLLEVPPDPYEFTRFQVRYLDYNISVESPESIEQMRQEYAVLHLFPQYDVKKRVSPEYDPHMKRYYTRVEAE